MLFVDFILPFQKKPLLISQHQVDICTNEKTQTNLKQAKNSRGTLPYN